MEKNVRIRVKTDSGYDVLYPTANLTNVKDVLKIENGGTGATTASGARTNLGLGTVAVENTLPISKGGTGATNALSACKNLGLKLKTYHGIYAGQQYSLNNTLKSLHSFVIPAKSFFSVTVMFTYVAAPPHQIKIERQDGERMAHASQPREMEASMSLTLSGYADTKQTYTVYASQYSAGAGNVITRGFYVQSEE